MRITQAVILAAGRGSRMHALTEDRPKCLVELHGRPILAWTMDALRANGIQDVLLIGGWQDAKLQGWAQELRVNLGWSGSNMVRSLQLAQDWLLRAPTLVVYGDGAYGASAIASALGGPSGDWVVPVDMLWRQLWERRFPEPLTDAESLRRDGPQLLSIGARATHMEDVQGQFMGLLRTTPAGWVRASHWLGQWEAERGQSCVDRLDMTSLLQALLTAGERMACVDVAGGWVEIDSAADLAAANKGLTEPGRTHDFRR